MMQLGPVNLVDGPERGRFKWGDKTSYPAFPSPDSYIMRDLGDDPTRPVRVTDGAYVVSLGPKCQVSWLCEYMQLAVIAADGWVRV